MQKPCPAAPVHRSSSCNSVAFTSGSNNIVIIGIVMTMTKILVIVTIIMLILIVIVGEWIPRIGFQGSEFRECDPYNKLYIIPKYAPKMEPKFTPPLPGEHQ